MNEPQNPSGLVKLDVPRDYTLEQIDSLLMNPPGLMKPSRKDHAANEAGRTPDLMHLLSKVAKVERSLTRPINGIEPSLSDQRSAAALRRLVDTAVRQCANEIECAMTMHPGRAT